ncbi:hypothetical protein VTN00DRAFT_6689 [Thermoascus crustaceus]|uniref:uncharacterized protein n=1 Tax=Thermoascus crustaceus TaxID=5088 RepID=UPI003742D1EE
MVAWRLMFPFRVCIFSLLRLVEFRNFLLNDLSSSSALESIFTVLEIDVAIICGNLPLTKPIIQSCLGRVKTDTSGISGTGPSKRSSGSKLYFHSRSSRTDSDGFQKIIETHPTSQGDRTLVNERGSDIELEGIEVHRVIEQEVESQSDVAETEAVSTRVWP